MDNISFNRIWIKAINSDESKAEVIPLLNRSYLNKSSFAPKENGFIRLPGKLVVTPLINWETIRWSSLDLEENVAYKILSTTSVNYYSCSNSQIALIALHPNNNAKTDMAFKAIVRVTGYKAFAFDHECTFVNHGCTNFETL